MRNYMTEDRDKWIQRILPIVLPGDRVEDIPTFLMPHSATHYIIESLTLDGMMELLRMLLGQPAHPIPPLGEPLGLLPPTGTFIAPKRGHQHDARRIARVSDSTVGTFVMGDYHDGGRRS